MKRVLCATAEKAINIAVSRFDDYEVVGEVEFRSEIKKKCREEKPDILILSEGVSGKESLPEIIIELRGMDPDLRVVFLTGSINFNEHDRAAFFESLVYAGVYDIIHEDKITSQRLLAVLDNPKSKDDVGYLVKKRKTKKHQGSFVFMAEHDEDEDVEDFYRNLYSVSSWKPGSGKTFVAINTATMIAEYGEKTAEGKRPKVALIEADLQNLSLGTLLDIENEKYNLKTVMDKIGTIVSKEGTLSKDIVAVENVNKFILDSFIPYDRCRNLFALVGSQLTLKELEDVHPMHYIYLVEAVINHFDVVIIDTNSALTHVTTFPLLNMSNICYYVMNLDYNNVRNNCRYRKFLENIGVDTRVRYVLNEDLTPEILAAYGATEEELIYTAEAVEKDFQLEAKIPMLSKPVFLNRIYEAKPLVLVDKPHTLEARYELGKIASQMWPIPVMEKWKKELDAKNRKKKRRLFGN